VADRKEPFAGWRFFFRRKVSNYLANSQILLFEISAGQCFFLLFPTLFASNGLRPGLAARLTK
jgi:hypothetical protein